MKAIISTTYSDTYLYFLPITTWLWNKLNVDVICFMPEYISEDTGQQLLKAGKKLVLVEDTIIAHCSSKNNMEVRFRAPEHKEATYAQCSRLYAACLDLPEDEVLITGDVDMANFSIPPYVEGFTIFGTDLVPKGQVPMCYISAMVKDWRKVFDLNGKSYQEKIDELLGLVECEHFRGNYWGKDQETAYDKITNQTDIKLWPITRSNGQNQFALNRADRTDLHYKDRLDRFNLIDAHLWRPGYSEENFPKILELMQFIYPDDNFDWLIDYTQKYRSLL